MKVSQRLFNCVEEIWQSYNTHPFVMGIGDGSLDKEKFRFYMIQDYLYLMDYSKVFALGVVKAKKEEHMQKFAVWISDILREESTIHRDYMAQYGITEEDIANAKPSLATDSYTKYMLSVAFMEEVAEIAVTVLACSWSYKCIGDFLEKIEGSVDHPFYGSWIKMYAGEDFRKSNVEIIELVDSLTQDYSEEEIKNLEEIITKCSKYEYMFWEMAWKMEM